LFAFLPLGYVIVYSQNSKLEERLKAAQQRPPTIAAGINGENPVDKAALQV
jgi:hypothetical protein